MDKKATQIQEDPTDSIGIAHKPLTPAQASALEAIRSHWRDLGRAPSVRELARALGHTSSNAGVYLRDALVARGLIERDDRGQMRLTTSAGSPCPCCGMAGGGA